MDIQQIFPAWKCKAALSGREAFSQSKPAQAPTASHIHLISLHFWEQGHHSCRVAQSQVFGLCTHISTELKIKFSTHQAEAGSATQHLQPWAHSYLKPACSLLSKLLARGTNNPVGPAITSPMEQKNWLEGRISWWSLYLSTSQQKIPNTVPESISGLYSGLLEMLHLWCPALGFQGLIQFWMQFIPFQGRFTTEPLALILQKLHMLSKLSNM